jgi:hypothetical protein
VIGLRPLVHLTVERSLVVLAGIALHSVADCEKIRDWPVVTMVVRRGCSGFGKIDCLLVEKKASTHVGHAFRVHSREQILAQLRGRAH